MSFAVLFTPCFKFLTPCKPLLKRSIVAWIFRCRFNVLRRHDRTGRSRSSRSRSSRRRRGGRCGSRLCGRSSRSGRSGSSSGRYDFASDRRSRSGRRSRGCRGRSIRSGSSRSGSRRGLGCRSSRSGLSPNRLPSLLQNATSCLQRQVACTTSQSTATECENRLLPTEFFTRSGSNVTSLRRHAYDGFFCAFLQNLNQDRLPITDYPLKCLVLEHRLRRSGSRD